jgi:hypothetical protein
MVLIRQAVAKRPAATGTRFEQDPDYRYRLLTTSYEDLPAPQGWQMHHGRADAENRSKALKTNFGADQFCLKGFLGARGRLPLDEGRL